jgi:hypothetical protein
MPAPAARRLRVERDINDYAINAYEPGKAPYRVASYIERREDARLFAAAPELAASLRETLRALESHLDDDTVHANLPHRDHLCPCNQNEVARAKALLAWLDKR